MTSGAQLAQVDFIRQAYRAFDLLSLIRTNLPNHPGDEDDQMRREAHPVDKCPVQVYLNLMPK